MKKLRKEKENVKYNLMYTSSAFKTNKAILGTVENDAAGFYGKHYPEKFRGSNSVGRANKSTVFKLNYHQALQTKSAHLYI